MSNEQSVKVNYLLQIVIIVLITVLGFMWKSMEAKLDCIENRLRAVEIQLAAHCAKTAQAGQQPGDHRISGPMFAFSPDAITEPSRGLK